MHLKKLFPTIQSAISKVKSCLIEKRFAQFWKALDESYKIRDYMFHLVKFGKNYKSLKFSRCYNEISCTNTCQDMLWNMLRLSCDTKVRKHNYLLHIFLSVCGFGCLGFLGMHLLNWVEANYQDRKIIWNWG